MGLASTVVSAAARAFPAPTASLWRAVYPYINRATSYPGEEYADRMSAFSTIYRENRWGSEESRSGAGSTLSYTQPLRAALPDLVRRYGVKTLLDAPCGDFHWMQHVDLPAAYIGGDLVPDLVDDVRRRHERPGRSFQTLDIVSDPLPAADLWLCRDVLIHLPNADALRVLRRAAEADIGYFLSTTYAFARQNDDIRPGGWRFINLEAAPFNLPPPLEYVQDFVPPEPPRALGLWSREQLRAAVRAFED